MVNRLLNTKFTSKTKDARSYLDDLVQRLANLEKLEIGPIGLSDFT
jgi:hypothetical protein